jgi:hypothetical protein
MYKLIFSILITLLFVGCNSAEDKRQLVKKDYFDLEHYITGEEIRLGKKHATIYKTNCLHFLMQTSIR